MEAQIMKLEAPFDYIYCNGEVGKHIGTYIVGESHVGKDGTYTLETHSHPIVQYFNSPKGVVWNKAELTDCVVLCSEDDMRIDVEKFFLLVIQRINQLEESVKDGTYDAVVDDEGEPVIWDEYGQADGLKMTFKNYGIGFKSYADTVEVTIEIGKCSDGYFVQSLDIDLICFDIVVSSMDEVPTVLKEQRQQWEELYDHVVKIKFTPNSSLEKKVLDQLK